MKKHMDAAVDAVEVVRFAHLLAMVFMWQGLLVDALAVIDGQACRDASAVLSRPLSLEGKTQSCLPCPRCDATADGLFALRALVSRKYPRSNRFFETWMTSVQRLFVKRKKSVT